MTAAIGPDVRTILFDLPTWIGDSVMATPVLRAAKAAISREDGRVIALARPGVEALLAGLPFVDELITVDSRGVRGVLRAARAIRRARPDVVVLLPNSLRSAIAARLGGARIRIGYARDGRGPLLSHALRRDRGERPVAQVEYYLRLIRFALGTPAPDPRIDSRIELAVTRSDADAADALLRGTPLEDPSRAFVLINPGANRADKRWPAERFAAVGDALAARRGLAIAVNGSPGERDVVARVIGAMKLPAVNLVERGVTLSSLKAIVSRAAVVVTNDTGTRHIAAALGTPVVALFGPTDHRWTTLPPGARERIVLAEPFLPAELVADDHAAMCAMEKIPATDVIRAAESLLDDVGMKGAAA
jgi:heptosyltransferase-2